MKLNICQIKPDCIPDDLVRCGSRELLEFVKENKPQGLRLTLLDDIFDYIAMK